MENYTKVEIKGFAAADGEIHASKKDDEWGVVTVAVDRVNGSIVDFFRITALTSLIDVANVKKGDKVLINGFMENRKFTSQNGGIDYRTEIEATSLKII